MFIRDALRSETVWSWQSRVKHFQIFPPIQQSHWGEEVLAKMYYLTVMHVMFSCRGFSTHREARAGT